MQRQRQVPGKVPEGSGGFWRVPQGSGAVAEVRFRKVAVQMLRSGSGRFRCRYPGEVPESFGADAEVSFWFMWHCLSHFAFHYVNHVMIWIWLSSFRDTGAGNLIAI